MKHRALLSAAFAAVLLAALAWHLAGGEPPPPAAAASADLPPAPPPARPGEPILPLPPPPALDPEKVALGRLLFHDPRLSADLSLSCASCHDLQRGGSDGRPVSVGVGGTLGDINAPSVLTAALNFRQFWDGRAASLEEQAGGPVVNPKEMAAAWPQVIARLQADDGLRERFARLYPDGLNIDNVKSAIADFERSLPRPSRFDRWLRGDARAISVDEEAGYRLFKKHGCVGCHQGSNVGGNLYQRFGVMAPHLLEKTRFRSADLGRYNVTGRDEDRHVFKVPGLRNVALTAPYFHDGSVATLEEAVAIMGRYQLGLELDPRDVALIAAFLATLSGEQTP